LLKTQFVEDTYFASVKAARRNLFPKEILFASHKKVYPGLKGLVWYESLSFEHENRVRHSMLAKGKHHK